MKKIVILITLLLAFGAASVSWSDDLRMDKETLKSMLDSKEAVILDVRTGKDWSSSEFKIKNAVRAEPGDFDTWSGSYTHDQTLVLYCA